MAATTPTAAMIREGDQATIHIIVGLSRDVPVLERDE